MHISQSAVPQEYGTSALIIFGKLQQKNKNLKSKFERKSINPKCRDSILPIRKVCAVHTCV